MEEIYHNTCFLVTYSFKNPAEREIRQDLEFKIPNLKNSVELEAFFFIQIMNLIAQLPSTVENRFITYSFTSHSYTTFLAQLLDQNGYIHILGKEKWGIDDLYEYRNAFHILPREKETRLFHITFQLTSIYLTPDIVEQWMKQLHFDLNSYQLIEDNSKWSYQWIEPLSNFHAQEQFIEKGKCR